MKKNTAKVCLFASILFLVSYNLGWGSGGSLISSGAFSRYSGNDTGYRQLVELQKDGDSFSAKPANGSIQLITLSAPGLIGGNLIIREIDIHGREKAILVTTPKNVYSHLKRATIFLSPPSKDFLFYREHQNGWKEIYPTKLIAVDESNKAKNFGEIWAYPVNHLGHFRLSFKHFSDREDTVLETKNDLFPMGSLQTGIFPAICAGVIFIVISILSYVIHKIECREIN